MIGYEDTMLSSTTKMTSQELLTFLKLFIMPCQHLARNPEPQTCTFRQTTRSRTHYLLGGTPCKARLHAKLQHGFKTRSTISSSCWPN